MYNSTQWQNQNNVLHSWPLTRHAVFHAAKFPWRTTSQLFMDAMHSAASSKQRKDSMWVVLHLTDTTYIQSQGGTAFSQFSELWAELKSSNMNKRCWLVTARRKTSIHAQTFKAQMSRKTAGVEKISVLLQHLLLGFCTLGNGFHIIFCWRVTWNLINDTKAGTTNLYEYSLQMCMTASPIKTALRKPEFSFFLLGKCQRMFRVIGLTH